jgi:aryl-alcohol dehydrogenase
LSFVIEELELDEPRDDEVLVRIVAVGVCHTDLKIAQDPRRAPRPIVLGHEGAGVVERVGCKVRKVAVGDPVVIGYDYCGECPSCADNAPSYCYHSKARNFGGTRTDNSVTLRKADEKIHGNFFGQSSFSRYALCSERNVVRVRKDAPLEVLGPLGCGIQTGAGAVMNSFRLRPGQSIAVLGAGAVGLSAVMAAVHSCAGRIIAVDMNEERLDVARQLGATDTINVSADGLQRAILDLTGHGVDYVLETTGNMQVLREGVRSLAPRGVCGVLASSGKENDVSIDVLHLLLGGRTIRGIVEGDSISDTFIPELIDLYMNGKFPFDRLIRFYPFARINEAVADAARGAVIKPVLIFD